MNIEKILVAAAAVSLLFGCGGGGGGGGNNTVTPSGVVRIVDGNADGVAGDGMGLVMGASDAGGMVTDLILAVEHEGAPRHVDTLAFIRQQLRRVLQASGEQLFLGHAAITGADITLPSMPCDSFGGFVTVSLDDKDTNMALSDGDSATLAFQNCDLDGININGSVAMANIAITGDPVADAAAWSISTAITITNLILGDGFGSAETLNGGFTYMEQTTDNVNYTGTLAGASLSDAYSGSTDRLDNFSIAFGVDNSGYTLSAMGTFSSSGLGGTVTFTTPVTLEGSGTGNPHTGTMKFVGEANTSVTAEVLDASNVRLFIDTDGDDSPDLTRDRSWASLTG